MEDNSVSHPSHYTSGFEAVPPECIRVAEQLMFRPGNAFKYVWRSGMKGGEEAAIQDLEKALQYLTFINDIDYTVGAEFETYTCAKIAFRAIKDDGSWKYSVLKLIVRCQYDLAAEAIEEEIKRIKNDKD